MTCEERLNLCMNCASMDCDRWIMYNEKGEPLLHHKDKASKSYLKIKGFTSMFLKESISSLYFEE